MRKKEVLEDIGVSLNMKYENLKKYALGPFLLPRPHIFPASNLIMTTLYCSWERINAGNKSNNGIIHV